MKKPELLAPAGSLSKLKTAFMYGADAVYFGASDFSLRAAAENLNMDEIAEGLAFAHERGKKCYNAVNILPRSGELEALGEYLVRAAKLGVDAFIISDMGVMRLAKKYAPGVPIHISTQASVVNHESAAMWRELGASRVILARELSFEEISQIRENVPPDLQLEAFVHGAMCVSYSGRCLLSNFMAKRDANRGNCAQPCRWKYYLMEEKREGEYFPIEEDGRGTYILNSRDLCMIDRIPQLMACGLDSLKIEGRVKSDYYVACVTNAYRMAIDAVCQSAPGRYEFDPRLYDEVCKVSHRSYYHGFYEGDQGGEGQIYESSSYIRQWDVVAQINGYDKGGKTADCTQKNRFCRGDRVEVMMPGELGREFNVELLRDADGNDIDAAPHPEMKLTIGIPFEVSAGMMIRKKKEA